MFYSAAYLLHATCRDAADQLLPCCRGAGESPTCRCCIPNVKSLGKISWPVVEDLTITYRC